MHMSNSTHPHAGAPLQSGTSGPTLTQRMASRQEAHAASCPVKVCMTETELELIIAALKASKPIVSSFGPLQRNEHIAYTMLISRLETL